MEIPKVKATVTLPVDERGRLCLARKKQAIHHKAGLIEYSLGLYNGYGGKREWFDFWILLVTAIRELWGEARIFVWPWNLKLVFRVYFYIKKKDSFEPFMDVAFYTTHTWMGQPKEGREMGKPEWFSRITMPYNQMMPADMILFEKMFDGEYGLYEVKLLGKDTMPEVKLLESFR